ncbi:hypothetical protein EHS25_000042 [Saitozyma podzolica]|uniref:Uncharacterized protein n=1 Tax=Saitozyma podzolica TaxID=1890683 RepID=A0A427YUZ7_9TREE|nr:hypothetical protein EHS25_000042 [Saitozyma podzolica]
MPAPRFRAIPSFSSFTTRDQGAGSGSESPLTRLLSSSARQVRGRDITVHALKAQGCTLGIVFSSEPQSQSQSQPQSELKSAAADAPGQLILLSGLTVSTAGDDHPKDAEWWLGMYSGALTQPSLRGALTEVIRASIDLPFVPALDAGVKGCYHKEATRETTLLTREGGRRAVSVSALRNSEQGDRVRILLDFDPNAMDTRGISTVW